MKSSRSREGRKPVSEGDFRKLQKSYLETCAQLESWERESRYQTQQSLKQNTQVFELDQWQQDAVSALSSGANVIVDAPTSAGKTKVVESFIEMHISDPGFRVCYTCPVKSLSNDKLREFRQKFGKGSVGIATGDVKENLDAPLVIATLESYRNSLLGVEPDLNRKLVIFDEYHFLQDESRGSAWEESIILTPSRCQVLLLSASISNANDFANWLEHLFKRPSVLIEVTHRPVPLANLIWHHDNWYLDKTLPNKFLKTKSDQFIETVPLTQLGVRLHKLLSMKLTPCIVYAGKRLSCELIAQNLSKGIAPIDKAEREKIGDLIAQADKEYHVLTFLRPNLRKLIQVYGIAYHHSGLAPMARLFIESLVKVGHLRFCVATMGLSLGINFSVKSTVISDCVRPGAFGFTPYTPSEVLQMQGRAGRRGHDIVGFTCWLNRKYYGRFGRTKRDPCFSKLKNDPVTFLGLVSRNFSLGKIEKFYQKSFQKFQASKSDRLDLKLIRSKRLKQYLDTDELPCSSPAAEFSAYEQDLNSTCYDCKFKDQCHSYIHERKLKSPLASLHLHLHRINMITRKEELSPLGDIARYFPQSGGFVIANMILRGEIHSENITKAVQLMGAFSLARFKSPNVSDEAYTFPFKIEVLEKDLQYYYPHSLFPELYEQARWGKHANDNFLKEFNPMAGYVVSAWLSGQTWSSLIGTCGSKNFGAGDITGLLYRSASFLQSLNQSQGGNLALAAKEMREELLREPLQINI